MTSAAPLQLPAGPPLGRSELTAGSEPRAVGERGGNILVVDDLRVSFPDRDGGRTEAVRGVSFTLGRERLGIVGESGSGKSQTGRAILGLTAPEGLVTAKQMAFHGTDLLNCTPRQRREMRGGRIAMVLQDPKFSLNPVMRIGAQIEETLQAHTRVSNREARAKALAALEAVQIDQPARVYRLYPHEVSGGMGQRAMIAMMLIAEPELLIADEPTSALDVTVQLQVLAILDKLVVERGMGLVFISHDLRLVSTFCDRILVMYAGRVVEEVSAGNLAAATHPYTLGLLNCLPRLGDGRHPLPTLDRKPEWAL
jgi:peptide/nickel transport system ATP-binding protein